MGQRGFTFVELIVAMAILLVGLLGVTGTLALQSGGIGASLAVGQAAVTRGYYVSTATLLAQERLEQMKRLEYRLGPPPVDEFGADPVPAPFPDENPVQGFPNFSRRVRVQSGVPASNMKTITVTVGFTLPTATGMTQESLALTTLLAARP
jgi:prepilin-type N-terminal cleavage/methylation domain-containing protein